jgi:hypothetical protein
MGIKGQKINPVGWRLGFYRKWKSLWFQESWNYGIVLNKMFKIQEILESFLLYKRFSALLCNIQIINQSTEKFIILVFFYNFRSKNTSANILQNINKIRLKTSHALYSWEKKVLQKNFESKKFLYNTNKKYNNINIFQYIKKFQKKNFLKKYINNNYIFYKSNIMEKIEKKNFSQKKTMKNWFFSQFNKNLKKKGNIIKFLNNNNSFIYNNKMKQLLWFKYLQKKNFLNLSSYNNWILLKKKLLILKNLNKTIPFINILILFSKLNKNNNILYAYYLLLLKKKSLINDFLNYQKLLYIHFFFKFFKINSIFSLILEKSFFNIFNILNYNYNSVLIQGQLNKKELNFTENLNRKEKILTLTKVKNLNISLIQKFKVSKLVKNFNIHNKIINKKDFYLTRKLIPIREMAVLRKIERLKYTNNIKTKWKYLSFFMMRFYNKFNFDKNFTRKFKNENMIRKYLELMSKHIYYTLPKIKKIKSFKKEFSNKDILNSDYNKSLNINLFYQKLIEKNSIITKFKWHFSLEDLLLALKIILQTNVNIFFINSLTFLKYQTRFIDIEENENIKKLGAKLLWRKIRLQKINASTQIKWLVKQPNLIERRGKRKGPFLQDFVFLALIALTNRQFKPLLRFINFQTKNIGKTKRQIPFLRFLMRILSNLAGGLIKIKGMRIQFKGRFDRWNRTKSLIFTTGNIPLQRKDIDIEYSSTKGMVKKGTYGIRFWVWYGTNYHIKYNKFFKTFWYNSIIK